jgi:exopolysaccharide biosynthesis polyprenyl glycosylphosphotransferase
LIVVTALAIRLDSAGPIFFKQERVGKDDTIFTLWKFRSMQSDAEKDGAVWAGEKDPRITRVGKWIRRLRIDELPQLINVFRGEMSLIGPRPERPEFVKQLEEKIPYYYLRHAVRPGITGWAQVSYRYGASVEDSRFKLEYDLYYVKNMSLLLDLKILLRTIGVVLFGQGAR